MVPWRNAQELIFKVIHAGIMHKMIDGKNIIDKQIRIS